ncbi:hypothetical protein ACFL6I_14375 [candidate division KSB1 bacterium]
MKNILLVGLAFVVIVGCSSQNNLTHEQTSIAYGFQRAQLSLNEFLEDDNNDAKSQFEEALDMMIMNSNHQSMDVEKNSPVEILNLEIFSEVISGDRDMACEKLREMIIAYNEKKFIKASLSFSTITPDVPWIFLSESITRETLEHDLAIVKAFQKYLTNKKKWENELATQLQERSRTLFGSLPGIGVGGLVMEVISDNCTNHYYIPKILGIDNRNLEKDAAANILWFSMVLSDIESLRFYKTIQETHASDLRFMISLAKFFDTGTVDGFLRTKVRLFNIN